MKITNTADGSAIKSVDVYLNEEELVNCIEALQTLLNGEGDIKYDRAYIEYEDHSVAITFSIE